MKLLQELLQLNENEEVHTIKGDVTTLKQLKDANRKYLIGTVNVDGSVELSGAEQLEELPVKFGTVSGDFTCDYIGLTSLNGAPSAVGDDFICKQNSLTSLKGAPSSIGGHFNCNHNQLTSLEGAPSSVGEHFDCSKNQLTSLKGAPSTIGGDFYCDKNKLTSLQGVHRIFKQINGFIYIYGNSIRSGGIGLILIEGLKGVVRDSDHPAFEIIEKYIGQGKKGLLRCQEELIDAGYEEFAKL